MEPRYPRYINCWAEKDGDVIITTFQKEQLVLLLLFGFVWL